MLSHVLRRSSSSAAAPAIAATSSTIGTGLLRTTPLLRFEYDRLNDYYQQEAYESLAKFQRSTTYPGQIKACSPGDTNVAMEKYSMVRNPGDKAYWRPVVDDPEPQRFITVYVRFQEDACVGAHFESRANTIPVSVPAGCKVRHLVKALRKVNESPYLDLRELTLTRKGKTLHPDAPLSSLRIGDATIVDAVVESRDSVRDLPENRMRDYDVDEMTPEVESQAPYAELKLLQNEYIPRKSQSAFRMNTAKPNFTKHGMPHGIGSRAVTP